jgi:SAM-dependent methyltransferase
VLSGGSSLHAIEAGEIGSVSGLKLLHLQCHIGLDTISLAHLGATMTGLDFSAASVAAARDFAARAGRPVRFVQSDVYAAVAALEGETFDGIFTGWGALNWLPDVDRWAAVAAALVRPGGFLYLIEGHPLTTMAMTEQDGRLVPTYPWRDAPDRPVATDSASTYTGDERPIAHPRTYEWTHPISDVVTALIRHGFVLEWLHEHDHCAWQAFPSLIEEGVDLWRFPPGGPSLPLAYSLKARRGG